MEKKLFGRADICIITVLLAAAGVAFFIPKFFSDGELHAQITSDAELVYDIKLSDVKSAEIFRVGGVEVEISPEGARVVLSDCPDGLCVKRGLLSEGGDTAVCVPERVVVKITSEKSRGEVDAVVY